MTKKELFKTAQATIACAHFDAGDIVAVNYSHTGDNGADWYSIVRTQNGLLPVTVLYPEHHLDNFVL